VVRGDTSPADPLVLRQDAQFRKFHSYLTAQYRFKGCFNWDCYRHNVAASLTRRFDAVKTELCPDGKSRCCVGPGFGHLGMFCTRLVIQSVSDVVAKQIDRSVYENR